MLCPKCNKVNDDGSKFCACCGFGLFNSEPIPHTVVPDAVSVSAPVYTSSTGASGFVNAGEGGFYSLRNGGFINVISGEGFVKEDAILTDKRLYYSARSGILEVTSREEIVNISDITGTKIAEYKPYSFLVFAALLFLVFLITMANDYSFSPIFAVLSIILVVLFIFLKKTFLRIEYAGGNIHFSVKKYGLANVRQFQRQIYIAKEKFEQ